MLSEGKQLNQRNPAVCEEFHFGNSMFSRFLTSRLLILNSPRYKFRSSGAPTKTATDRRNARSLQSRNTKHKHDSGNELHASGVFTT